VPLHDLCLMYLWRFAIEHAFRFMKQHLGLNANQSTPPDPAMPSSERAKNGPRLPKIRSPG
jgi:hypothetical protein